MQLWEKDFTHGKRAHRHHHRRVVHIHQAAIQPYQAHPVLEVAVLASQIKGIYVHLVQLVHTQM